MKKNYKKIDKKNSNGKNAYIKIICIIDKSGSMECIRDKAISGFNEFLNSQKKLEGKAKMSLILFDTSYEKIFESVNVGDVNTLNHKTYVPNGGTALLDAIGQTIDNEIEVLSETPKKERPKKTLCIIITDGEENSSHQYGGSLIKQMINEQREMFNWEFLFMCTSEQSINYAESMGISRGNIYSYAATDDGIGVAYTTMSDVATVYRSSDDTQMDFSQTVTNESK
jgi:uncharacterized protein YegL